MSVLVLPPAAPEALNCPACAFNPSAGSPTDRVHPLDYRLPNDDVVQRAVFVFTELEMWVEWEVPIPA
jgi:hypothetical protein